MGDYVHLILKDEDDPEKKPELEESRANAPVKAKSIILAEPIHVQEEDTEDKVLDDLLYVV